MLALLRLGGFAVYPILAIGALGLIAALRRAFRWGVVKDHRPESLALDDGTPLHLALATLLAGVAGTGIGVYKTLSAVEPAQFAYEEIAIGVKESLTCLVLGAGLAVLIVLAHVGARIALRRTGVPR
jgi:hypothetical protein